ncbi:MAG TPA: Spy/CpxP family protein refolding chaperone [Candidatus Eisenbacteria bacterium]|nr:Spy/CpxP family protein refolding chaperone [Candidatus Eisenbacteria bacterium]
MKSIRFRLLIATLAVLLGSVIAKSQTAEDAPPPPPMHGHAHGFGPGGMDHFLFAKLNLTDDQKAQAKAIMQKEHPLMRPLFQQDRQIDLQIRQYVEGNYDEAKVQALAAQKAQVQQQITMQETRTHNELYQLLTADQKTQLKQLEAQHEQRMQERMQRHMQQQQFQEQQQ